MKSNFGMLFIVVWYSNHCDALSFFIYVLYVWLMHWVNLSSPFEIENNDWFVLLPIYLQKSFIQIQEEEEVHILIIIFNLELSDWTVWKDSICKLDYFICVETCFVKFDEISIKYISYWSLGAYLIVVSPHSFCDTWRTMWNAAEILSNLSNESSHVWIN